MRPFRRRRSRGRPLYDPELHRARLAAADAMLAAARREAAAIRGTPPPLHSWLNLQLGPRLPITVKPKPMVGYAFQPGIQYSTFTVPQRPSDHPAGTGNRIHDEALRNARGY